MSVRGIPMQWTPERYDDVDALLARGLKQAQIGAELGLSVKAIQNGLSRRRQSQPTLHVVKATSDVWPDDKLAILRSLWSEGLSTAAIGRRMNISKNSVIGKVHRLGLPSRPSPIRERAAYDNKPPPRGRQGVPPPPKVTLAPIAAPAPLPLPQRVVVPMTPAPIPAYAGRVCECSWPIGEPRTPGFRFCDEPSVPGKSYCGVHHKRSLLKVSAGGDGTIIELGDAR